MNIINFRICAALFGRAPSFLKSWIRPCDTPKKETETIWEKVTLKTSFQIEMDRNNYGRYENTKEDDRIYTSEQW